MEEVMVLAASSTGQALAIVGLVVGLVVFALVVFLLQSTLTPLRRVLTDLTSANTAPMLQRGVPGTDQLGQTRRLADSVPPLALAYLAKLGAGAPAAAPAPAPPPSAIFPEQASSQPAWQRYGR
jgi:hypothetical protein